MVLVFATGFGGLATIAAPITIIDQPVRQTVVLRLDTVNFTVQNPTNVVFAVNATGDGELRYQWRFHGTNLESETSSSLTISNVTPAHAGNYSVEVSNGDSAVISSNAFLTVLIPPVVVAHPPNQSVVYGGAVNLSVTVTGYPPPFTFQWRRRSTPLTFETTDAQTSTYTIPEVTNTDYYRAVITNAALGFPGVATRLATLSVINDTDGDGMSDEWEARFGLKPADASDATLDADEDGLSNRDEYLSDTDPLRNQSFLAVDRIIQRSDLGGVQLEFTAVSNLTYTLQYADQSLGSSWRRLATFVDTNMNRVIEYIDRPPAGSSRRYYRLVTPNVP